jgi:hypothetical protein
MGYKTPKGNPIKGSACDPKGKTVGVGTKGGRAPVAFGSKKPKIGVTRK